MEDIVLRKAAFILTVLDSLRVGKITNNQPGRFLHSQFLHVSQQHAHNFMHLIAFPDKIGRQ